MKAKITANRHFCIGTVDRRIYGSFIEHLGRAIYTGIYEPEHPEADEKGFRKDVLDLVRQLNVPIIRYPGGNFVSGYNWEDGTGDPGKRPRRMDPAWKAVEPNLVGIDEFQEWAKRANSSVMMAVNLGTRGVSEACACLEYCNAETDTYYADLRRKNGFEKPFGVRVWCLGNEMDGPWQLGHKTAEEYGRLAEETAKAMRLLDPTVELVACGSSGPFMKTFGDWEWTVLDHTYDHVQYLSLHRYYGNGKGDTPAFLASAEDMDDFIKGAAAICDGVKAKKHSKKTVYLSFDEWNVWYHSHGKEKSKPWEEKRDLLEDVYDFEDALVVGTMLITLQNNCDRVKIACLAQLVNVIAPIMTEPGGKAWAQTIFYPFLYASAYGNGTTLRTVTESDGYEVSGRSVPYLIASVIHNDRTGEVLVYAVNRSLEEEMELEVCLEEFGTCTLKEHTELYSDDLLSVNDRDHLRVSPAQVPVTDGAIRLKKHSWNLLRFACGSGAAG